MRNKKKIRQKTLFFVLRFPQEETNGLIRQREEKNCNSSSVMEKVL